MTASNTTAPWYRHFWVWVLILLPLAVITAGLYTLFIAGEHPDALVVDDYYREGLAINRRLDREAAARARGIRARLSLDRRGGLTLRPERGFGRSLPELELAFIHPTRPERDRRLSLRADGSGIYRSDGVNITGGRWHIRLRAPAEGWQLDTTATLEKGQDLLLDAGAESAPSTE